MEVPLVKIYIQILRCLDCGLMTKIIEWYEILRCLDCGMMTKIIELYE